MFDVGEKVHFIADDGVQNGYITHKHDDATVIVSNDKRFTEPGFYDIEWACTANLMDVYHGWIGKAEEEGC